MTTSLIISILLGALVGVLPLVHVSYLLVHIAPDQGYGRSALSLWYAEQRLASLLMVALEIVKPAITFIVVGLIYHNDILAIYAAFVTSLFSYYSLGKNEMNAELFKVRHWKRYYLKGSRSPLPLLGFLLILSPVLGYVLCASYLLILFFVRRAYTACIVTALLTPCFVAPMVNDSSPYLLGFILPLCVLYDFRKRLFKMYPFEEPQLPPLL